MKNADRSEVVVLLEELITQCERAQGDLLHSNESAVELALEEVEDSVRCLVHYMRGMVV